MYSSLLLERMKSLNTIIRRCKKDFNSNFNVYCFWVGFLILASLAYIFVAEWIYGFLFTVSAFCRTLGFTLLNYKIWKSKNVKGISIKTLELYAILFILRLVGIKNNAYLPNDRTGDFFHIAEIISLFLIGFAMFNILVSCASTYDEKFDKFGALYIPHQFGIAYILLPCIVLAYFVHPSSNVEFLSDFCWVLSMYIEAVAMLPQVYMFQVQAADKTAVVEPLIGHTMFTISISRCLEFAFWLTCFYELVDANESHLPGIIVLASQLVHLVIMGDFFYYYFKSVAAGLPLSIPSSPLACGV